MRMLHTMIRVGDLQRSIDFYTQVTNPDHGVQHAHGRSPQI